MMVEKRIVSMTPDADGFAARYDRMVERSGGWVWKAVFVIVVLFVILALASRLAG